MKVLPDFASGSGESDSDSPSPRGRFRAHLKSLGADLAPIREHLLRAVPQIDTDPEARLALEELVSHLGSLVGFHTSRDEHEAIDVWGSPTGLTITTRVMSVRALPGALGSLAQARERRLADTAAPSRMVSALGVICGTRIDWRPIEDALSARRGLEAVRLVSVDGLLALAALRGNHVLAHPDAVVLLRPQERHADAHIDVLARRGRGSDAADSQGAEPVRGEAWWIR